MIQTMSGVFQAPFEGARAFTNSCSACTPSRTRGRVCEAHSGKLALHSARTQQLLPSAVRRADVTHAAAYSVLASDGRHQSQEFLLKQWSVCSKGNVILFETTSKKPERSDGMSCDLLFSPVANACKAWKSSKSDPSSRQLAAAGILEHTPHLNLKFVTTRFLIELAHWLFKFTRAVTNAPPTITKDRTMPLCRENREWKDHIMLSREIALRSMSSLCLADARLGYFEPSSQICRFLLECHDAEVSYLPVKCHVVGRSTLQSLWLTVSTIFDVKLRGES
ncbi:hypothetical protein FB451DRAFT_1192388 [Mycena latifolia]|nr:hypothetical protein FB451DRAFT_1192388 [Mycena latifolia]